MFIFGPLVRQYLVVIVVCLVLLCVGMDLGWASPALVKLNDPAQSPFSRPLTEAESGWIVSIGYIFSIFTLPFMGFLADCIGRKYCILVVSVPKIVACLMTIFGTEVWMLLVARAINGTMSISISVVVMIYTTEIASKEIRGSLCSIVSILSCTGSLIMLAIGPYLSYLHLNILATSVTVCAVVPQLFIPDTPFSMYKKGKIEEAKKVLTFFRGSETLAEEELKEFGRTKPKEQLDKKEIFRNKAYMKVMVIVILLGMGVQFNGFYFIMLYLQTILDFTNTNISSALCSVLIGITQLLSSIFAVVISDRFGRKYIIITTFLGVAAGLVGLGIFFALQESGTVISGFLNYLPLISIALVAWCHGGGVGSQYLVLVTELLDDRIRAIGTSASILAATTFVFLQTRYTLAILSALGFVASFVMFAVICVVLSIFVYFVVPETKKMSFADIQKTWEGGDVDRKSVTKC